MLVDSHCHLNYPALAKQRDQVMARAHEAGVRYILIACTTMKEFPEVLGTANAYENAFCGVGVHPHHAGEKGEKVTADEIARMADNPKVIAIGETGLDYFYNKAPREEQIRNFREHIRAALIADLPIIVHNRDSDDDTIKLLKEENIKRGVLHCFSSGHQLAEEALKLGFYISFSGILTFAKSEKLQEIARDIPVDRLLVETDAPYLAPEPFRGKLCEPAHVVYTAKKLAEIKGLEYEELAQKITDNFFRLFSKAKKA